MTARDDLKLPTDAALEMARLVQQGDEGEMRRAEIVMVRSGAGRMKAAWIVPDDEAGRQALDGLPQSNVLDRATLHDVVFGRDRNGVHDEGLLDLFYEKYKAGHPTSVAAVEESERILEEIRRRRS